MTTIAPTPENKVIVWLLVVIPVVTVVLFALTVSIIWCYRRLTVPRLIQQVPRRYGESSTNDKAPTRATELHPVRSSSRPGVGVSRSEYFNRV